MALERVDILLNVTDVGRSLGFYRDLLGLQLDSSWADADGRTRWARLIAAGGGTLMLNEPSESPLTDRPARPPYRDAVVYLRVSSTDELGSIHRQLTESGFEPGACHDETYGQREFLVRDPDGYELAVCASLES